MIIESENSEITPAMSSKGFLFARLARTITGTMRSMTSSSGSSEPSPIVSVVVDLTVVVGGFITSISLGLAGFHSSISGGCW